jgi:uncharacterized protein DUF6876
VDIDEEDALYRKLAEVTTDRTLYPHPDDRFSYTEGVRLLTHRARVSWFIDLIALLQPQALADADLRNFQLWELHRRSADAVAVCSRDEENQAFRRTIRGATSELGGARLYVVAGVLHLPLEAWCRRLPHLRQQHSVIGDQPAQPITADAKKGGTDSPEVPLPES